MLWIENIYVILYNDNDCYSFIVQYNVLYNQDWLSFGLNWTKRNLSISHLLSVSGMLHYISSERFFQLIHHQHQGLMLSNLGSNICWLINEYSAGNLCFCHCLCIHNDSYRSRRSPGTSGIPRRFCPWNRRWLSPRSNLSNSAGRSSWDWAQSWSLGRCCSPIQWRTSATLRGTCQSSRSCQCGCTITLLPSTARHPCSYRPSDWRMPGKHSLQFGFEI